MTDELTLPDRFRHELRDALLEHAATLPGREQLRPRNPVAVSRAHPRRVPARRLGPALALAAVIVAAGLLLRSGVAPPPATAAGVFKASAAALDRRAGSRTLGPGDYFYTRVAVAWRYAGYGPHPYVVRSIQEEWLARDGHGRSRYDVVGLSGAGAQRGSPLTRSRDTRLAPSARPFVLPAGILLSYAQLRRLPTEPTRLGAALNRIAASSPLHPQFAQRDYRGAIRFAVLRALAEAPTSAPVRAALYRLLAATPGIHLLGRTRDSIGRYGMAVAIDAPAAVRLEIIVDPATGDLLQTSRTLLHRSRRFLDGRQPPGLINRATFLASGIVTSTRAEAP